MKKIKVKLTRRSSQTNLNVNAAEWNKYDDRLLECIQQDDTTRLKSTLTKKNVSAVKLSPNGTTALHRACEKGSAICLGILLDEKPDLSVLDKAGCSVLSVAAKEGMLECMVQILQHNKGIIGFQDYHKKTALHYAAAKGHCDCVKFLLENDEILDVRDKDGRTPLLMGIQSGKEDVVKLLLDSGAKVNITDNSKKTALMYASLLGHEKSVDLLLKRGANSNFQDNNGHTAEDYARIIGYKHIITMIKNAPTVATWDAGEDNEEDEEEDPVIQNGEFVSEFTNLDFSEDAPSLSNHNSTNTSPKVAPTANIERTSLQESFSSKTSTTMSAVTMQRDLAIDVKELEEENEMLNQELNKLRIQHQKTIERLRLTEDELNALKRKPVPPDIINGSMEHSDDFLVEKKERQIEELEHQVSRLKIELMEETRTKQHAEKEIETLNIQVSSYQALDANSSAFSEDENDDLDLPEKSKSTLSALNDQISMLKIQNENLRGQLKEQINTEINYSDQTDEPSISFEVYQQLKDSSEDEIFSLSEQIEEMKIENEDLNDKLSLANTSCQTCTNMKNDNQKNSADLSPKKYSESEIQRLKNQMKQKDAEYKLTINLYRLHLIASVQGELAPEVDEALQMIIGLRASEQFC